MPSVRPQSTGLRSKNLMPVVLFFIGTQDIYLNLKKRMEFDQPEKPQ